MGDNINVTVGDGTGVVAADEIQVDGTHAQGLAQFVKLVDGTLNGTGSVRVNQAAKANALTVAPASDISDATYIGDIKFGESEPNSAAIKTAVEAIQTAVEIMDDWDDANYLNANMNIAGTDVAANAGVLTAQTLRVTIATNDECNNYLGTIDADTGAIKTAVELLDNAIDGNYLDCNLNFAGTDAQIGEGVISASTLRVTIATDDDGVAHLATIAGDTTAIQTAVEIMDDWDAVHDSAASSDGVQLMAAYDSTKPTAVGDADAVRVLADTHGRLLPGVEPERAKAVYDSADASGEGETVIAAPGVGIKLYVTSYIISVDAEMWVKLQDEDSNALTGKMWFKAGGGVAISLPPNTPLVLDVANKALEVITEGAGNISVSMTYYPAP